MSEENLEAVRRIHEAWSRGDFSSVEWADPEIEFRTQEFMGARRTRGVAAMGREWREWLQTFEGFRSTPLEYFESGDQVVTFNRFSGTAKKSGLPLEEIPGAARFKFRGGRVVELEIYTDHEQALRDAGIER